MVHAGTGTEHLSGARPSGAVRGDVDVDTGLLCIGANHAPEHVVGEPAPLTVEEYCGPGAFSGEIQVCQRRGQLTGFGAG